MRPLFTQWKQLLTILVAGLALNTLVQRMDFPAVDAFFLDIRQQFSFDPPTSGRIVTVTVAVEERTRWSGAYTAEFLKQNLDAIAKARPKAVLLTFSHNDFGAKEFGPLRKLLDKYPNVYILSEGTADPYSFIQRPEFSDFKNTFNYIVPRDKNLFSGDGRPRRMLLNYKTINQAGEEIQRLKDFGMNVDLSKFKHSFDYMNTDQIFFKMRSVGAYGQISAADVRAGRVPDKAMSDKLVILGGFDEFDFYAEKSFFRRLSRESEGFAKNQYWPINELLANQFDTLALGTYLKIPPGWVDQVFCIGLIVAFLYLLMTAPPNLAAILSIPFILSAVVLGWAIYLVSDFALDLSRPTVVMLALHILAVPLILAKYVRRKERERAEIKLQAESEIQRNRFLARSARAEMGFKLSLQVAHDLRSPVTAIQLVADLSRQKLPEDMHRLLKESVDRLNGMAQDLLTRFKDGQAESLPTPVGTDLTLSTENVVATFRTRCPEIQFDLNLPRDPLWIAFSAIHFERALTNLIGNAVEAVTLSNTPHAKIEVILAAGSPEIVLRIQDNGPGVPKELNGKLFQMGSTHGKTGGTGLGLNQAREVFLRAGGDLRLIDVSVGACFEARIPRRIGGIHLKLQPHVLIADDSAQVRELWKTALAGKDVEVVADPTAALAVLAQWASENRRFTLITDLIFSGFELTGFDLIDAAKGDRILCTTLSQHPEVISYSERHGIQLLAKEDILKLSFDET